MPRHPLLRLRPSSASRSRWGRSVRSGRCWRTADRIQGFLLLPRDEAEDFFFSVSARDQADLVCGMPGREQRSWVRLLPPGRRRRPDPGGADREARRAPGAARRADPPGGDRAPGLLGGQRRRPDEPALHPAAPRDDGRRGDQLRAQADARAAADHLLRLRAGRRAAPPWRGVVPRALHRHRPHARRARS